MERCPECQRGNDYRPWPIYTVRLADGRERCARCLRALDPSFDGQVFYSPPPVILEPQTTVFQLPQQLWSTEALLPDWWKTQTSFSFSASIGF